MSVDPLRMLEQLEAEENTQRVEPTTPPQDAPSVDPESTLTQLEKEYKEKPGQFEQPKVTNTKKNLLGRLYDAFTSSAETPSFSKSTLKFIAGGFIDDSGKVVTNVEGSPKDILVNRAKGSLAAMSQGLEETGQGAVQMSFDVLEGAGFMPDGLTEYYTRLSEDQRKQFEADFNKEFGHIGKFAFSRGTGKMLPILAMAPLGVGATIKTTLAKGTALSGAIAGSEFIPENAEEERMYEALKGAGWSFVGSALLNIVPHAQNFFKKKMIKAFDTKFAKEGAKLSEKTGVELSATQLTDDPAVRALQQTAEGTIKGQRLTNDLAERQILQTRKYWDKTIKSISKVKSGVGRMVTRSFEKTLGSSSKGTGLRGARKNQADKDFAVVNNMWKGKRIIKLDNFEKKAKTLMTEWRTSADKTERAAAKEIGNVLHALAKRNSFGKREYIVSAKKMQNLLQTYGRGSKGRANILGESINPSTQQKFSSALFNQLNKDFDTAIKSGIKGAKELKAARNNYRAYSKEIERVTESAIGAILTKSGPAKGLKLEQKIMKLDPDDLKATVRILRRSDPQMASKLQRLHVENILKESHFRTIASQPNFKPGKMLDLDSGRNKEYLDALFEGNARGRAMVKRGLDITERIMLDNAKAGGNRLMTHLTQAAGVAASMDKTFQARLATELLTPRLIAKYIQTGEGLKSLLTLSKPYNVSKYANALIKLNNIRKEQQEEEDGD